MPTVYLATLNSHKVQELQTILKDLGRGDIIVHPAATLDPSLNWDETGTTFVANARIKALAVRAALIANGIHDASCLADDSGLSVDALGGAPGIHSARYAGPEATAASNNAKLCAALQKLDANLHREFTARFTCVLYYIDGSGRESSYTGVCEGTVAATARGQHGFGYDPLFRVAGQNGRTMAELSEAEKNQVSHRRRALDLWLKAKE